MEIIIITGGAHSGKSTLAAGLSEFLKQKNITMAGILALGLWKDNQREGFDLVDLATNVKTVLARRQIDPFNSSMMPFCFFDKGMEAGAKALDPELCRKFKVIMVDEVGKLELKGEGWAPLLEPLLSIESAIHIWIVRDKFLPGVLKKWNLKEAAIVNVNETGCLEKLISLCTKENL